MIGILAGMGPMSTAPFIDLLMTKWQAKFNLKYDIDYPEFLIYSLPTPFYVDKPIDHVELENAIKAGLIKLQNWGAKLIAMPCNTAHLYFSNLADSLDVELLNIISATIDNVPKTITKVTIFATESTFNSKLYQAELAKAGINVVFQANWQQEVNKLIGLIKAGADITEINNCINHLMDDIKKHHIDCIILGCTELSKLAEIPRFSDVTIVDSAACLVDKIIQSYPAIQINKIAR